MNFKQLHLTFAGQIETVKTVADLPTQGIVEGAIRYIEDTDTLTMWDGSQWGGLTLDSLTVDNLTVNNIAYIDANVVEIGDNIVVLNSDVIGTPTEDAGIVVNRGSSPDAQLLWDEDLDTWVVGVAGNVSPIPGTTPAFTFARSGLVGVSTWLLSEGIPSNVSGVPIPYSGAKVRKVFIDSGAISSFAVELFEHDHVSFFSLGVFTVTAAYGDEFSVSIPITEGRILAAQLKSGSAQNVSFGLQLQV